MNALSFRREPKVQGQHLPGLRVPTNPPVWLEERRVERGADAFKERVKLEGFFRASM
jgi:hypothetical protein